MDFGENKKNIIILPKIKELKKIALNNLKLIL